MLSPHTLTIHQLSSTITSSNPPTPTPISDYTQSLAHSSTSTESSNSTNRADRIFKRKFPNHPFPSKPGTAREYINHPDHTNTTNFLQITLPLFPQYTLNQSDPNPEPRHFVDEHVLIPTLHWTAYYNFTNPLTLSLYNTTIDIERNKDELFRLTTALTPRQFTYVGYKKLLKTFTAPALTTTQLNITIITSSDLIKTNFLTTRNSLIHKSQKSFLLNHHTYSHLTYSIKSMITLFQKHYQTFKRINA